MTQVLFTGLKKNSLPMAIYETFLFCKRWKSFRVKQLKPSTSSIDPVMIQCLHLPFTKLIQLETYQPSYLLNLLKD